MKRMLIGALSIGVAVCAVPASATIIDFGPLSAVPTTKVGSMAVNGRDIGLFSLSTPSDLGASLRAFVFNLGAPIQFSSLTALLFAGSTASGPVLATLAAGSDLTVPSLAAGNYSFSIDGVVAPGAVGGIYALSLASNAAAPAPGPAGLLIGGAALGAIAWKHRKRPTKAA